MKKMIFSAALMLCGILGLGFSAIAASIRFQGTVGNLLVFFDVYDLLIPAAIFALMLIFGIVLAIATLYKDSKAGKADSLTQ